MQSVIELLAVVASATYGVLLARRHQMDFVGVFCLAFIVAFGGGTLRDLFLDRHPLFWIKYDHYPIIVFALAILTSLVPRLPTGNELYLSIPDALGLGLFSVAGTNAALDAGTSAFVATLMGAVTGTFGGVIGDVICNRVPSLFRTAPLFATCSFVGSWFYVGLTMLPRATNVAAPIAIAMIVVFRLLALKWNWVLPQLRTLGDDVSPTVEQREPSRPR